MKSDNIFVRDGAVLKSIIYPLHKEGDKIVVPEDIRELGSECCKEIKSKFVLELPKGLKKIQSRAFANSLITGVTIPSSVTEIEDEIFLNAQELVCIINHCAVKIKNSWFEGCRNLQRVTDGLADHLIYHTNEGKICEPALVENYNGYTLYCFKFLFDKRGDKPFYLMTDQDFRTQIKGDSKQEVLEVFNKQQERKKVLEKYAEVTLDSKILPREYEVIVGDEKHEFSKKLKEQHINPEIPIIIRNLVQMIDDKQDLRTFGQFLLECYEKRDKNWRLHK